MCPSTARIDTANAEAFFNNECRRFAQQYGYKEDQLDRGLEGFAAHVFIREEGFNLLADGADPDDAELTEYLLRGNDLGADIVLPDEDNKRILIAQCAFRGKVGVEEDKVKAFFDIIDHVSNPDYLAKGGDQVQHLLGALPEQIKDGYEVVLRFVTNRPVGEETRLRNLVVSANKKYLSAGRGVTCELLGRTELLRLREQLDAGARGAAVPSASFKVQQGMFVLLDKGQLPYKTLIGLVKANELVALYGVKGVGQLLFNLNVRLPLASKKINPRIELTATSPSEAQHFFYYNNGISAVCSDFNVEGTEVTASRLQIINGAQTLSSLVKAKDKDNLRVETYVLLRLTATEENYGGVFTDNVIAFNNTQNPVKAADFFSNDALQKWIAKALAGVSGSGPMPTIQYIYKSGMKPLTAHKSLGIEELANIRHSFLYGPVVSYREPKSFFVQGVYGRYEEAFGIGGSYVAWWDDETLAECCAAIATTFAIKAMGQDLKKKEREKPETLRVNIEAKYLDRLARYVAALISVGLRAAMPSELKDFRTLMASKATFDSYYKPLGNHARTIVRAAIAPRYQTARQPEYNFARSEPEWVSLESQMREAVENGIVAF